MKYSQIEPKTYSEIERLTYNELESDLKSDNKEYITVYSGNESDFTHNGIAVLNNVISCYEIEELNGDYYIELQCIKDERRKYLSLKPLSIIKVCGQLFRIPVQENIQENDFRVKLTAEHIFYDLNQSFNEYKIVENGTVIDALTKLLEDNKLFKVGQCDVATMSTSCFKDENPVASIFNGILPLWGGELLRDNYTVSIKQRRGKISGVTVKYGKNIKGFTETLDYSRLITRMYPVGKDGMKISDVNVGKNFIDSPRIYDYPIVFSKAVNFSDAETPKQLLENALQLWGTVDIPAITYKIKFIDLSTASEYELLKDLIKLELGDTVIIDHKIFNIKLTARVIKIKKNILTGNIEELELGQFLPTIFSKINNINTDLKKANTTIEQAQSTIKNTNNDLQAVLAELATKINSDDATNLINTVLKGSNYVTSDDVIQKQRRIKFGVML